MEQRRYGHMPVLLTVLDEKRISSNLVTQDLRYTLHILSCFLFWSLGRKSPRKDSKLVQATDHSGRLKAKGHPNGATGVSMRVLTAMQLAGEVGAMQIPNANLGGIFDMDGAAVANYVSILEPLR